MIVDYEGAPVFDCMYKGDYYTVKSVDNNIVSIEKPCSIIGSQSTIQREEIDYDVLKEENEHFMMILKKGKI